MSLVALPGLAADPFRPDDPHAIGDVTEDAFEAFFYEGNYVKADQLVQQAVDAESTEPMAHAMAAALAYLDEDWTEMERHSKLTQQTAQDLLSTDPLRGHLYSAVGIFLEGAHILQTRGITRGTPVALRMLQQVFNQLDEAERIDPADPELSLLKGFMDLLLAVNLPFANPDQAIGRLQQGYPPYLSHRGIAIGLRDLERYDEALVEAEKALEAAPDNPELIYLKAQILRLKGDMAASIPLYNKALEYSDQLHPELVDEIQSDQCRAEGLDRPACDARFSRNPDQ